jgi:hypothetical protein
MAFGKTQPARGKYPGNGDFGSKAWALPTRELADKWAAIVVENVGKPGKERLSFVELFSGKSQLSFV